MKNGEEPDSAEVQNLVKMLQNHITDNYYLCTNEILAGLGQMYIADERFRNNIDKHGDDTWAQSVCNHTYCFYVHYGLRIKMFKSNATKLKDSNIKNVVVYPPVISKILFETVAMSEPPITVKVMIAMFVDRFFIP